MVTEKEKNIVLYSVAIIAIIGILVYSNIIHLPSLAVASGTVLSISPATITSGTGVSYQVFKTQVALGAGYDTLKGTVSSSPTTLTTAIGQKSQNSITVSYSLDKEFFKYPLILLQDQPQFKKTAPVNFDLRPNFDYGYKILTDGTHYLSPACAIDLLAMTRTVQGDIAIAVPSSCYSEYYAICRHYAGMPLTTTTATNHWNLFSTPKTGLKCLVIKNDETKPQINYMRPTERQPDIQATITVTKSNGGTETIVLTNTKTIQQSTDVRAAMTGMIDSLAPDAPDPAYFYVTKSGTNVQALQPSTYDSINKPIPISTDEATLMSYINNYNTKLSQVLTGGQTGFVYTDPVFQIKYYDNSAVSLDRTGYPSKLPLLDLEIKADWIGIYRPMATGTVTLSPSSITLAETGNGATIIASVNKQGEGTLSLNPPICSPYGITPSPSSPVSITQSFQQVTYTIRGGKGTYSCGINLADADGKVVSTATFSADVKGICTAKPINLQTVTYNADGTCQVICDINHIDCGANGKLDPTSCSCTGQPPSACPSSCPSGQLQNGYPDCSCHAGTCPPDTSIQIANSTWNTFTCKWECPQGQSAIVVGDNKLSCSPSCTIDLQCGTGMVCEQGACKPKSNLTDYLLYGIAGIATLGFVYIIYKSVSKKRR